jgi:hypothetical protein
VAIGGEAVGCRSTPANSFGLFGASDRKLSIDMAFDPEPDEVRLPLASGESPNDRSIDADLSVLLFLDRTDALSSPMEMSMDADLSVFLVCLERAEYVDSASLMSIGADPVSDATVGGFFLALVGTIKPLPPRSADASGETLSFLWCRGDKLGCRDGPPGLLKLPVTSWPSI